MIMEDLLINTLSEFGYPVRLQGSLADNEEYPKHFFTFWNNSSNDAMHYDNKPVSYVWDFDVNFYSTDPALIYDVLDKAISKLKSAGFMVSGKGYSIGSDEPSHTGRGVNVLFLEQLKGE